MPAALEGRNELGQFQSAPGREAGRCPAGHGLSTVTHSCFNPRPAVRPGDAELYMSRKYVQKVFQSAPGREAGRCPAGHGLSTVTHSCFNPRPAVRPGDAHCRNH